MEKTNKIKNEILNQEVELEWLSYTELPCSKLSLPVTQVYGICFNLNKEIVIMKGKEKWTLPGGTPEGRETVLETLQREIEELL